MDQRTKPIARRDPLKDSADPAQRNAFDRAHARSSDPATSRSAAASVTKLRASQARILSMFRLYGDMTDERLTEYLHDAERTAGVKLMSPSGIRSRRSELSKPNMERLDALAIEVWGNTDPKRAVANSTHPTFAEVNESEQRLLRDMLRTEGFRDVNGTATTTDTLWDTGKREPLASGRMAIVWGIAR